MNAIQFGEEIINPINRLSVYGVILNESKQILVANVNGKYHLPGGGIDAGEDDIQALKREILEETGYEITDIKLIGKANQFIPNASVGPMNKIGTFYSALAGA
jgi:8-oxo-dGTP diphosphatase